MAISSIHIEAGKIGYFSHNSRERKTVNSIFDDEANFVSCDNKTAIKNFKGELELRTLKYLQNHSSRTKLHSKTLTHLSAIVNFNKENTPDDIQKVCEYLEKTLDTKVIQFAMHRDEGHINNNEAIKNYHAHIEFMGLDSQGNSIRRKLDKKYLINLQTEVAKLLNMQRGKNYTLLQEPRPTRFDTYEWKTKKTNETKIVKKEKNKVIKQANEIINNEKEEKKKLKEELEELKKANNLFREEIKTNEDLSTRENFKLQEDLNRQLQEDLKNKSIELDEALKQIEDLKEQMFHPNFKTVSGKRILNKDAVDYLAETNQELEKKIKELEQDLKQEHSINAPSFQQKILFEKYQHLIKADLKGYYIDTKGEETKILNKSKDINITDKGSALISHSNGTQNLQERVKIMLDLSEAKGWELDKINVKGNELFKNEIKRQINERLLLKELHSYKTNLNALQAQNEQLASENITLSAKLISSSNIEELKAKNKELEKLLKTSMEYTNIKLKEIKNANGSQTYNPMTEDKLKELLTAKEKRLNNESFENLNKTLNKFVGNQSTREVNNGREI